jgi:thiamine transport system permease protein
VNHSRAIPAAAALLAVPVAFLVLFAVYPVEGIVRQSFFREGSSFDDLRPLWADSYYLERAWFSLWQAAASTALTLALALPYAWLVARTEFRGKGLVLAVTTVPFVLPAIVVAVAFSALLGPQGAANNALEAVFRLESPPIRLQNTIWIILLAHVFYNFAIAGRIIGASWARLDSRLEEAAAVLGEGPAMRFARVTLPLLRPAILAAASLVFLFCFTSFGVVLILGGTQYSTIETEIYRETTSLFRLPIAATLALLQMVFTFAVMAVYTSLQRGERTTGAAGAPPSSRSKRQGAVIFGVATVLVLFAVAPLAALVERSLHTPAGYSLTFYRDLWTTGRQQVLFIDPIAAIGHSLGFAALATALAVPLGTLGAYGVVRLRRGSALAEAALLVPLGVSAVTLGLGFLVTFDEPPINLRGSWWIIVFAHTLAGYPFVVRTVGVQLRALDERLREAARTLGAGPARIFLAVDLPLIWRSVAVGAVFAFAVSMGEFGATLLLTRPEWATIPVAVFRLIGRPGAANYGQAVAMSVILMAVTTAGFLIIDRLRFREIGTF